MPEVSPVSTTKEYIEEHQLDYQNPDTNLFAQELAKSLKFTCDVPDVPETPPEPKAESIVKTTPEDWKKMEEAQTECIKRAQEKYIKRTTKTTPEDWKKLEEEMKKAKAQEKETKQQNTTKNAKDIDKILKKMIKPQKTLPVKDLREITNTTNVESVEELNCSDDPTKPYIIEEVLPQNEVPGKSLPKQVKPIRKSCGSFVGKDGKIYKKSQPFAKKDPIIVDDEAFNSIGLHYGKNNYFDAVNPQESSHVYYGQSDNSLANLSDPTLTNSIEIPNIPNMMEIGKAFYDKNKNQMQQQMNVVSLYSIKDAKPFYYISSAEARMAIEYITTTRKYKTDMNNFYQTNYSTVKFYNLRPRRIILVKGVNIHTINIYICLTVLCSRDTRKHNPVPCKNQVGMIIGSIGLFNNTTIRCP